MTEIIQPIVGRSIASVQSGGLDDGYQELVIAIIKQAEKDYEGVLLRLFMIILAFGKQSLMTPR